MTDHQTIAVYDAMVEEYAKLTLSSAPDPTLEAFIGRIDPGGLVLDLGCGPANASAEMRKAGLQVDPVDASIEMVNLANVTHDIGARQAVFDDITGSGIYDGIWANFSLLHASAEAFTRHLDALYRASKPGGWFHLGMKLGTGSVRDRLARRYTYYSQAELSAHLTGAGFHIVETRLGEDPGLAGEVEPWVIMLARC